MGGGSPEAYHFEQEKSEGPKLIHEVNPHHDVYTTNDDVAHGIKMAGRGGVTYHV